MDGLVVECLLACLPSCLAAWLMRMREAHFYFRINDEESVINAMGVFQFSNTSIYILLDEYDLCSNTSARSLFARRSLNNSSRTSTRSCSRQYLNIGSGCCCFSASSTYLVAATRSDSLADLSNACAVSSAPKYVCASW